MDFEWDPGMKRETWRKASLGKGHMMFLVDRGRDPRSLLTSDKSQIFKETGLKNVQIISSHSINAESVLFVI